MQYKKNEQKRGTLRGSCANENVPDSAADHQSISESKLISIVVPVYKVEKYLSRCIESVLSQDYNNFELILVDDGSPDSCPMICDTYSDRDSRIRVIHQENGGLSAARNSGLKVARGEYVTFIDSDDYVEKFYLSTLYRCAEREDAEIAVIRTRDVIDGGNLGSIDPGEDTYTVISGAAACRRIMEEEETFMITAWGKLYKRVLFPLLEYPVGMLHEDEYVTYKAMYSSKKVVISDRTGHNYLQREGSIMASFAERNLKVMEAFREAVPYFDEKGDSDLKLLAEKRLMRMLRVYYLRSDGLSGEIRESLYHEWNSLYSERGKAMKKITTLSERLADKLFASSPEFYCRLKEIVR